MTKAEFIKEIAKREGKKTQVTVGNIREIVSIIEDIEAEYVFETQSVETSPIALLIKGSKKKYKALVDKPQKRKKTKKKTK